MGYNVYDVLRIIVLYYRRKHKNVFKSSFGYNLKLLSFKMMKHIIYKELTQFQNFIFIQKKNHLPKQLYAFFITICKKIKIHSFT